MASTGKTKKYFAPPLTAEQISAGVGVTEEDKAIVRKVLTDLGYIGKKTVRTSTAPKASKKSKLNR
ncbi:MAG TPA: hypothetical protein VF789_21910 [Thermoanaerobaculia bacterium]